MHIRLGERVFGAAGRVVDVNRRHLVIRYIYVDDFQVYEATASSFQIVVKVEVHSTRCTRRQAKRHGVDVREVTLYWVANCRLEALWQVDHIALPPNGVAHIADVFNDGMGRNVEVFWSARSQCGVGCNAESGLG